MKKLLVSLATILVVLAACGIANAQPPASWESQIERRIAVAYGLTPGVPRDVRFDAAPRLLVLMKDGTQAMGDIYLRTVRLSRQRTMPVTEIVTDKESLRICEPDVAITDIVTLNYYIAEIIDVHETTVFVPVYLHGATMSGVLTYICGVEM